MKSFAGGAWLSALAGALWAPTSAAQTPFRSERFEESWPQEASAPFGARFKNLAISEGARISFGGDARWRLSAQDAPRLGLDEADAWILQRLLLHADLRLNRRARVFVELGVHDGMGRNRPASSDDDRLDLQQGFIDAYGRFGARRADLRLGRQELVLGPRFVTARDSANVRQRFDLARLTITNNPTQLDLFAGRPTRVRPGAFDDDADPDQTFLGVRLRRSASGGVGEVYLYALDRADVLLAGATAQDDRFSIGAHYQGRVGAVEVDVEAVAQRGQFGDQSIRAHGAALEIARRIDSAPLEPRLAARFTYGQGDHDSADGVQETFAPPFSTGSWFGQNGLSSFSNIVEGAGIVGLTPSEALSVNLKLAGVWRASTADAVYSGGGPLMDAPGTGAFTGAMASISATWRPSPNVTVTPYVSYTALSGGLEALGAHDVAYGLLSLGFRF